ncbi:nuclear transport factor 2 family protein [Pseudomonas abietaniphila]|uniref:nuclear transport factor 2 family protein n=1 Tax=Pseudomonas abietaniphila TaxID=89065 RepID=UPI00078617E9|nr:nuclear transport factor 2 family protein [Pseudomonas abietaniphila]
MTIQRYVIAAAMVVYATLASGFAVAQGSETTTERNRTFIAQAFANWAAGGKTFFQDVVAPDVIWTIKGTSPVAGTYRSRDDFLKRAVAPFAARLASPVQPTVKDIWADRNDVIVYWDGVATAADGATYRNSYVWIFRMKNLRATEVVAFLDLVPFDDVIRRIPLDT